MREALVLIAGIIFLPGVVGAQNPTPARASAAPEKDVCSVSGQVVRAASNAPLRKAYIHVRNADEGPHAKGYGTRTDDSGRFSITGIPSGRYSLRVERVGYVDQFYGESGSQGHEAILALAPGENAHDLLFRMVPWSVISGRITNENGEPVIRASVVAMRSRVEDGERQLDVHESALTNDLGEYRIWSLGKGRYYIRADRDHSTSFPSRGALSRGTGYAPVFYPGTSDVAQAVALDVRAGQEVPSVDFILVPARASRVSGHVTSAIPGYKMTWANVMLAPASRSGFQGFGQEAVVDTAKGSFQIDGVVAGSYDVLLWATLGGTHRSARQRIEVRESDLSDVDLAIEKGAEILGRISGVQKEAARVEIVLKPAEGGFGERPRGDVKADGTFVIGEVSEGKYGVDVAHAGPDVYLKSVRIGAQDVLLSGINVGPTGIKGTLEVELGTAGGVVEGAVTDPDGLPVAGATTVLIPDGKLRTRYSFYRDTTTDQHGKFIFRGVRPGEYKVFSWQEVESGDWEEAEFIKPVEEKGVKVTVEENGRRAVEVKVISGDATAKTNP